MGQILLWIVAAMAPTILAIWLMVRLAEVWLGRRLDQNLRAAQTIATLGIAPDGWVRGYRRRIARIKERDANQARKLAEKARRNCLRRLEGLIRFYENVPMADGPEVRTQIVRALQHAQGRWSGEEWFALMGLSLGSQKGE